MTKISNRFGSCARRFSDGSMPPGRQAAEAPAPLGIAGQMGPPKLDALFSFRI
ncbi:MAG: hypothetical protein HSCHL_0004 [Hydrogenibacillus schlegelii]|uniref:Uncharacterized protein n=1 Tax=Hydrogenibacillus schlegelii TaxID=1484 RepID=A0A2T5G985_HYDSH|nr:MAG: hypothetical protein HSCHL_0004 [Hydrogenibacillus schlegelii]